MSEIYLEIYPGFFSLFFFLSFFLLLWLLVLVFVSSNHMNVTWKSLEFVSLAINQKSNVNYGSKGMSCSEHRTESIDGTATRYHFQVLPRFARETRWQTSLETWLRRIRKFHSKWIKYHKWHTVIVVDRSPSFPFRRRFAGNDKGKILSFSSSILFCLFQKLRQLELNSNRKQPS